MTKIEEHLGVRFGEDFYIKQYGRLIKYYITSNLDLYRSFDNELSKDFTVLDLLRDPKLIKRITIDKYDIMGLKFYQSKGFKYITRDKNNSVWIWKNEPDYHCGTDSWVRKNAVSLCHIGAKCIDEFSHIGEIEYQKERPYTIEEIIKKGEK